MAKINIYQKGSLAPSKLLKIKKTNQLEHAAYLLKPLPLILYFSNRGQRIQIPLGISVAPKFWDGKQQKVKNLIDAPLNLSGVNEKLQTKRQLAELHLKETEDKNKKVTKASIKDALTPSKSLSAVAAGFSTLDSAIDNFMNTHRNGNGFELDPSTKQKYRSLKVHMKRFNEIFFPYFDLLDIDVDFMKRFQNYLYDVRKCNDNTVAKYTQGLKTFTKFLVKQGITIDSEIFQIRAKEFEKPIIVLELQELEKLTNYEFEDNTLSRTRDVFIFASWTGQRYSDVSKICRNDISIQNGTHVWMVTTQKTNDCLTVPLNDYALDIIERYIDEPYPIPRICDQHFNRQLKEMARVVGLDRLVRTISRIRGNVTQYSLPLHEVLTSHIARKSFISNSLILGMSESEVKKISGHKDDRSFRRYVELGNSVLTKAKDKLSKNKVQEMIKFLS